jgi:hypothetical protein
MGKGIVKLGEGQWAVKDGNLLAAKETNGRFKNAEFTVTRGTDATYVGKDGLIFNETGNDTPRIDFTDNTDGHLLLEPESRNLVPYSNEISLSTGSTVSGTGSSTAVTDNYAISPDGTQNAARLVATSATGTGKYALRDFILSTSSVKSYTQSTYLKSNTGSDQKVSYYGRDTGVRGFITVTSEWQRFELSGNSNTTNYYVYLGARPEDGTDTSCDILVYGYQLEQLGYATSLIPTNGSQVTRDAETCTGAGSSADFNSEEGVLYAEIAALADDNTYRILSLSDETRNERVYMQYTNASNTVSVVVKYGGVTQANMAYVLSDATNFSKVAIKYKANDFALWVDGVERATDTSGNTPTTLNKLQFNEGDSSGNEFYGKVKAIRVYKETDGIDLATLTSL